MPQLMNLFRDVALWVYQPPLTNLLRSVIVATSKKKCKHVVVYHHHCNPVQAAVAWIAASVKGHIFIKSVCRIMSIWSTYERDGQKWKINFFKRGK